MGRSMLLLVCACVMLLTSLQASAKVVHHTFHVGNHTVRPLCKEQVIVAVNKRLPGPTIRVRDRDTLVVDVFNDSPYNITVHWHGVFQKFSGWADGPSYVTQCPIMPGNKYTYKFNITGQEGTLWWHAHSTWIRATVYGALLIRPRAGLTTPFPKPYREVPLLLGEWWDANVVDVENQALASGGAPNNSDAYTINGKPGRLYSCSRNNTYKLKVVRGKTYLLKIINAALNNQLFFKVAGHNLTVVGMDAAYTDPFPTDVVVVAPGQTTDVLLTADQAPGAYFMAAHPYLSANISANNSTTTGIIQYEDAAPNSAENPIMPILPAFNDTPTAHRFFTNLTSLSRGRKVYPPCPLKVDEHMFITFGLNILPCQANESCPALNGSRLGASMNNISFQLPNTLSMLEAHFRGVGGIFTEDFPDNPPVVFDYTNATAAAAFQSAERGTRVKKLAYNATVEMVLQNTAVVAAENHPIHLHGFNFYVLAQGFGNFNRTTDESKFNLVNPQERNTIAVPVGGWAVVRFRANNPGVWLMHCHLDVHLPWGLSTAFEVEDGPTPSTRLPPPPLDLPKCFK